MTDLNAHKTAEKTMVPYLALLLVQLIFGFNFAASKVILEQFPPLVWAAIRMLVAAVLMFLCSMVIVPKDQRRMDFEFLKKTFIYGLFGIAFSQSFFMMGLHFTTTTNAAVLNTLTPIFTLLFAIILGKEKFTRNRAIGFLIAVSGVLILRKIEDFQMGSETLKGDLFTILNCASLAIFFTISRDFLRANSAFWATSWMFLFGAVVISLFCLNDFSGALQVPIHGVLLGSILYNVIGATMITYFLNSWTLKKVPASSVAVFIYLQPVIAVLFTWVVQHEPPTIRTIAAVICIFIGVMLGVVKGAGKIMRETGGK